MKDLDLKKINKRYYKLFQNYKYIIEGNLDQAVQEIDYSVGAFNLNSPIASFLKTVKTDINSTTENLIIRLPIEYSVMREIEKDKNLGYYLFSNYINFMLSAANKKIQLDNATVTFLIPGRKDEVFRELEFSADYELRLCVEKNK